MDQIVRHRLSVVAAIVLSAVTVATFILQTKLLESAAGPLILFAIVCFVLLPYRSEYPFVSRFLILSSLLFVLWFLSELGIILLPFVLSFFIAYLLDPLVTKLSSWKINRTLVSLFIILTILSALVAVSVFFFPSVFEQMNDVIRRISSMVTTATQKLESRQFYKWLETFGLSAENAREIVQKELAPQVERASQVILTGILSVLTSLSSVAAQAVNVVLIPILSFYFLNDLPRLKRLLESILQPRSRRVLHDLARINDIVRAYISGQIISALFVGTMATIAFMIMGIPYGIVLGVLCGLLNPIPYLGILASLFVAVVTILLVNADNSFMQIIQVALTINVLHLITTYIIDPRVTGSRIGLHPVMIIASLFVFGHFFGFLGLLVAMPATAVLMMYFSDWRKRQVLANELLENIPPAEETVKA